MGAGASLGRLRKAVVIRSYNLRRPDQTVEEQFKCFTFRSVDDGQLYIRLSDIRNCLGMDSKDYGWIEELFAHTFGGKVATVCDNDTVIPYSSISSNSDTYLPMNILRHVCAFYLIDIGDKLLRLHTFLGER